MQDIPSDMISLIITSPPYNIGKEYEVVSNLDSYIDVLRPVIEELVRVLSPSGSLCWQVGNYVNNGEIVPLDILYYPIFKQLGLKLRNRIVWHFEHGLHASKRLSGRYETMLWFTKTDQYVFNLDPIRVPSKYPGKRHFKGKDYGKPSGNPLGKNPSDLWTLFLKEWETGIWDIPNVKANHPEKTSHPCQFPIELVERCVLSMTNEGDWVLDPFAGAGSTILGALLNDRKGMGCEIQSDYVELIKARILDFDANVLKYRPVGKPVYHPTGKEKVAQVPQEWKQIENN